MADSSSGRAARPGKEGHSCHLPKSPCPSRALTSSPLWALCRGIQRLAPSRVLSASCGPFSAPGAHCWGDMHPTCQALSSEKVAAGVPLHSGGEVTPQPRARASGSLTPLPLPPPAASRSLEDGKAASPAGTAHLRCGPHSCPDGPLWGGHSRGPSWTLLQRPLCPPEPFVALATQHIKFLFLFF